MFKLQEQQSLEEAIYGKRRPLSWTEYENVFSITGLDVDGRMARIAKVVPYMEPWIESYAQWSKAVPGFKDLSLNDQLKRLKGRIYQINIAHFVVVFYPPLLLNREGMVHH